MLDIDWLFCMLQIFTALAFSQLAFYFYKSKDGKLRKLLILTFGVLALRNFIFALSIPFSQYANFISIEQAAWIRVFIQIPVFIIVCMLCDYVSNYGVHKNE